MKEKIKIKNGILKKFNIDKTIEILKIGYTLDEDETNYKNAIIVREGENKNIITDNSEAIMRFFNLYALQNEITLEEVFKDPFIIRLEGEKDSKMQDLITKIDYLYELQIKKESKKEYMICSFIISLLSYGLISIHEIQNERILIGLIMLIASFLTGKYYVDTKNISISQVKKELNELIQEFGEELIDKSRLSIIK